jgi:PAS domain-containing protein
MSINLETKIHVRHSRSPMKPDLFDSLLASGAPYVLVDPEAKVLQTSEALQKMVPGIVDESIGDAFHVDRTQLLGQDIPYPSVQGFYENLRGEKIPAILQTVMEHPAAGSRLVLVTDGAPFRQAENQRFDSTPYAVMRVSPDGIVHFANAESFNLFPLSPDNVIGRPLDTLFEGCGGMSVAKQLDVCLKTLNRTSVNVTVCDQTNKGEQVRLLLLPDLTADSRALGALVVIQSMLLERVREDIAKLSRDPTVPSWEKRLERVIECVGRVFDFDHANFGIYDDDVSVFRALAIYPKDQMKWTERWLRLPEGIITWLKSGQTAVPDINKFLKNYPDLANSEVAKMYVSKQLRSSATLVATGKKDMPTSALSFSSKQVGRLGQAHVDLLRELDLEPVLIRIENEIRSERERFAADLRDELACAEDLPVVAREIVDQIATRFKWDFVALFRVDRNMKQFELFHHNPCKKRLALSRPYLQPIDQGMLASTLRKECTLVVNDIDETGQNQVPQHGYLGFGRPTRSAMTIPVHLNGRIRWILNIEATVAHAFHGPDRKAIERLTATLEEGLKQRTLAEINAQVLKETEQGVVTVGMDGAILDTNAVARRLLGRTGVAASDTQRELFSMYASPDDPRTADVLSGLCGTEKRRVELVGDDGEVRPVLATYVALDESFDAALWFLTDLHSDRWTVDLRFLRETVTDVAQQTRAPLALASSIARQLPKLWNSALRTDDYGAQLTTSSEDLSRRLVAEINKADITFERLAENLNVRREPARNKQLFDFGFCVGSVINGLPKRDRERVDDAGPNRPVFVNGDPERLVFAIRSTLAHLIRILPAEEDARVWVSLSSRAEKATLILAIADHQRPCVEAESERASTANLRPDALWRAYKVARGDASLGLSAVRRVIKAHDGKLKALAGDTEPGNPSPPWVAFRVTLPVASRSNQP